ncbi:uncharacterized protein TNCV_1230861 [Trichonephila clavipes]|nr:uncharacterized protein TNCV_1230861 [Trichonephila clavipes]
MEKGQLEMQKGLDDIKNELKERMEKGQEETKQEMQKGLKNVQKYQVELKNSLEERTNSVEDRITGKMKEDIARVEDLEKKLLAFGKTTNENKFVPAFAVPVPDSPVSVKLSTYYGKTNWEVYKAQFCIISEANGWTEGFKACQLAPSLRGEASEVLQTLPETERLNLNSLDLRFGQKYSKDYTRLQMKTRLQKTGESLQEYASEVERLANLLSPTTQ